MTVRPALDPAMTGRRAGGPDVAAVEVDQIARIMLAAAVDTPDSVWLIPDRGTRLSVFAVVWPAVVRHGLVHGHVDVAVDTGGATVGAGIWLDPARDDPGSFERLLRSLCGVHADRFAQYEAARTAQQPPTGPGSGPVRLAWLAVAKRRQGRGIGTALLRHRHADLDQRAAPAYTAATSSGFRDLAARHGYQPAGATVLLPGGGPSLWPMVRHPVAHGERLSSSGDGQSAAAPQHATIGGFRDGRPRQKRAGLVSDHAASPHRR